MESKELFRFDRLPKPRARQTGRDRGREKMSRDALGSLVPSGATSATQSYSRIMRGRDCYEGILHVRFCPHSGLKSDIALCLLCATSGHSPSFDHFVGLGKQRRGYGKPERFGGLEVNHQFEFRRLLHRQVSWVGPLKDFVHIRGDASEQINIPISSPALSNVITARPKSTHGPGSLASLTGRPMRPSVQPQNRGTIKRQRR